MHHSIIKMLGAPCGAGKTYAELRAVIDLALKNLDIVVAVPSINLIEQWRDELAILSPSLKVNTIHSDNVDRTIGEKPVIKILSYLHSEHKGEVLLITQTAFNIVCEMRTREENRHLILDEIPKPFSEKKYGDKDEEERKGLKRILECIEGVPDDKNPSFYIIQVTDLPQLREIAAEREEDGDYTPRCQFSD